MIYGDVIGITVEIIDLVNDVLIEFFKARREQELELIGESVGVAMNTITLPIKQHHERGGKLAWKTLSGQVHKALIDTGIVKSYQRQKDLKAALDKAFFLYSSKFKTKKQMKEELPVIIKNNSC